MSAEEAAEWLAIAETEDLKPAQYLLAAPLYPKPFRNICYHAQQCAEKSIKAIIVVMEPDFGMPKVHDISFLLNQVKKFVNVDKEYYDYGELLTPYAVEGRYPFELYVDESLAVKAVEYAGKIHSWARKVITEKNG